VRNITRMMILVKMTRIIFHYIRNDLNSRMQMKMNGLIIYKEMLVLVTH
jgi:hypothetical protein